METEENMLDEEGAFMTLARIGAQAIMTRAEPDVPIGSRADGPSTVPTRGSLPYQG